MVLYYLKNTAQAVFFLRIFAILLIENLTFYIQHSTF